MNTQLATQENVSFDSMLQDVDQMQAMCKKLMASKHYQKMGEDGIFAIIQKAKSIGMNPMEALNGGLYYLQGKIGMSTEAMNALIRKAGHSITKDAKSTNSICILHGRRADNGDVWTVSFSLEDAKRAGLMKNMFEKYPGVMLFNRAMSMLARQLFPDIIKGAGYTHDELKEIAANSTSPKIEHQHIDYSEEKISEEQVAELTFMLSACDPEVVTRFEGFIKNHPISAQSIAEIPVSQFSSIKAIVTKRYNEAIDKQKPKALEVDTSFDTDAMDAELAKESDNG